MYTETGTGLDGGGGGGEKQDGRLAIGFRVKKQTPRHEIEYQQGDNV